MTFAQQIRAYRITAGLTQAELAAKIGYSQQTVNNWETQRVEPWPRKKDTILDQVRKATGCGRFSELIIQKRTRPNVCEEITGESSSNSGSQESVAHPEGDRGKTVTKDTHDREVHSRIDFRRPPARG
jgi:hypothetical protein